jgi:hypothetical protein
MGGPDNNISYDKNSYTMGRTSEKVWDRKLGASPFREAFMPFGGRSPITDA